MLIANILLLIALVALLTVVPLLPGLIAGRLLRAELARDPRGIAEF